MNYARMMDVITSVEADARTQSDADLLAKVDDFDTAATYEPIVAEDDPQLHYLDILSVNLRPATV